MPSDPSEQPHWQTTALGRQLLGERCGSFRFQRPALGNGSRVVLDLGVFLPNYDRGEPGGSGFDQMPDYEGQSQEAAGTIPTGGELFVTKTSGLAR